MSHYVRQSGCATLEEFEQYAAILLAVSVCAGVLFSWCTFHKVLFQDLMNAADEIILQGISELGISGIDYYATPANQQGFYCCDELLVQMKDWWLRASLLISSPYILRSQFISCDFVRQFYLRNSFWVLKQVRPRQYRQLCSTYQQSTALSRLHWVSCSSCRWNMFCSPNSKTDVWLVWGTPSNSTLASCFGRGLLFVSFHPPKLLWTISALPSIESHVLAGSSKYCGRACWLL